MIFGRVCGNQQSYYQIVESPHPCSAGYNQSWQIVGPSQAVKMRLHFPRINLRTTDRLFFGITGGYQYATAGIDQEYTSWWLDGNKMDLRLAIVDPLGCYGFQLDRYDAAFPAAGATVILTPGNITAITTADGYYCFSGLAPGGYTITPSLAGATFSPGSLSVGMSAYSTLSLTDFVAK
jgi:hypothetical protein